MSDDRSIEEMARDRVELSAIASTRKLKALIAELDAYREALGRDPSYYAVFRKHLLDRGGINNALSRANNERRANGQPVVGIESLRHRGIPVKVFE